jgi:hypothetical protein
MCRYPTGKSQVFWRSIAPARSSASYCPPRCQQSYPVLNLALRRHGSGPSARNIWSALRHHRILFTGERGPVKGAALRGSRITVTVSPARIGCRRPAARRGGRRAVFVTMRRPLEGDAAVTETLRARPELGELHSQRRTQRPNSRHVFASVVVHVVGIRRGQKLFRKVSTSLSSSARAFPNASAAHATVPGTTRSNTSGSRVPICFGSRTIVSVRDQTQGASTNVAAKG